MIKVTTANVDLARGPCITQFFAIPLQPELKDLTLLVHWAAFLEGVVHRSCKAVKTWAT